jgi:anti-sigma factor RsiW
MTPTPSQPDPWTLTLLAYADGELSERERAEVQQRLAEDSVSQELLRELEALSPRQRDRWAALQPPAPAPHDWDAIREALLNQLPDPPRPRRDSRFLGFALALAIAAAVMLAVWLPRTAPPPPASGTVKPDLAEVAPAPRAIEPDLLAEFSVLPVAGPNDVMISAVRGNTGVGLVTVNHPIPDTLELATGNDLDIEMSAFLKLGTGWEVSQPDAADAPVLLGNKGSR